MQNCIQMNVKERKRAPLYWSAYEYLFEQDKHMKNAYIPENVWQDNINWISENLKAFGFDMICIDGWGDDFTFTENGYRAKHSSKWEHSYQWWSQQLQSKGLTLGIYNNPLWVSMQAVNAGKMIKGTNIPLENIINRNEKAMFFTWVQVEKDGARQYVKGYVQYYADMGVKFLRVDFLSWFEDGKDCNPDLTKPIQRPKIFYQLALKWIKQACEANNMAFSLVMPHLYNYAQNELTFAGGSMIRINADVGDGGWQRFNNIERGIKHQIWSTYDNAFDGFVYWSGLSGFASNKMVLDGDFTRINTFANDLEKQTAISLQIIAGGPLAITDQFNTIKNDISFFQNSEMLELNYTQFVGKPLSSQPTDPRSQIWKGLSYNNQWIVALFNRQNEDQTRTFDFSQELDFPQGHVRDLWQHKDLGLQSKLDVNIKSHGCKIFRIAHHIYQAESPEFSLNGGLFAKQAAVTLTTKTNGAIIFYTLDGSEPSPKAQLYTQPIYLKSDAYIRAISVKEGIAYSFIVSNHYVVKPTMLEREMYVAGTFTGWALPNLPMSYLGENQWKSPSIWLNIGSYEFKVANSSDWSKVDWGNAQGLSGYLYPTTQTSKNAKFSITSAGLYYFYFNPATLHYSITSKIQPNVSIHHSAT